MKNILVIFILASALAWASNATGIISRHSRSNEVADTATPPADKAQMPPAPPEATATPAPVCGEGEYYDKLMGRCRRSEDNYTATPEDNDTATPEDNDTATPEEAPGDVPTWGAEIQATMDADPYDNDYLYLGWECADLVGGVLLFRQCTEEEMATPAP